MVKIVTGKGAIGVGSGELGGRGQSFARDFGEALFAVGAFGFDFCPFRNTLIAETVRSRGGGDVCEFLCLREWLGAVTQGGAGFATRRFERSIGQSIYRLPGATDLIYDYTYV